MSGGSRQTETQEKKEEPNHDAKGYEHGSHWNSYTREEFGRTAFLVDVSALRRVTGKFADVKPARAR
jgi:hypothetical protein